MSKGLSADPAELRASAGACDDIARSMKEPADKAVTETETASGSLTGWSIGGALEEIATSWKPALNGLRARAQTGGDNLRTCADAHGWNEERASQDFENTGTDTSTQGAFGAMPAALRPQSIVHPIAPAPGIVHPIAPATSSPDFDPVDRPLDPRAPYGTNMPTYDESISTQPAPRTNDFG